MDLCEFGASLIDIVIPEQPELHIETLSQQNKIKPWHRIQDTCQTLKEVYYLDTMSHQNYFPKGKKKNIRYINAPVQIFSSLAKYSYISNKVF